ncbi:WD40 repeat domain-containing protein [Pseudenhygromyxa sp. WMMC2535]|uniref:WD40 repeat domain-containing protein n=1 Tax=Pseudenhygromyxa sp. WMMC2535 TaxID=2712867 RepID=UPI001552FCE0|nr:WD40 repeat domain-containing protein [Pseudenhygromyxa sp. WMMC2535]NVB39376.1 WD40 repeat domain-containing protein [Pseudenhygromyxa sp. WMMC2535]
MQLIGLLVVALATGACRRVPAATPGATAAVSEAAPPAAQTGAATTLAAVSDEPCRAGELLKAFDFDGQGRTGVGFSPDGEILVTVGLRKPVHAWDGWSFELLASLPDPMDSFISPVNFVGGHTFLLAEEKAINFYDIDTGESRGRVVHGFPDPLLTNLQVSRSGQYVLTTGTIDEYFGTQMLTIWDVATTSAIASVPNDGSPWPVAISDGEDRLVALKNRGELVAYELPSGRELGAVFDVEPPLQLSADFKFLPGGHRLVAQTTGQLMFRDVDGGEVLFGEVPSGVGLVCAAEDLKGPWRRTAGC